MNQKQSISSHLFRAILNALTKDEIDINSILVQANISKKLFSDPDYRIDDEQIRQFWRVMNRKAQDEFLGLTLGSRINISELGITGMFFTYSSTIREALEKQINYNKLLSDFLKISLNANQTSNSEIIEFKIEKNHPKPNYILQCQSVILTKTIQDIAGKEHQPEKIWLDFPVSKDNLEKFTHFFKCPLIFNEGINAIEYKSETLDCKLLHRDSKILEHIDLLAKRNLYLLLQENCLSEQVSALIRSYLYTSNQAISLSEMAKQLSVSGRTLQRKLKQESASYGSVLESVRNEEAIKLIKENKLNINEIAWFLGYSEASTFVNQFKNWTGKSPSSFK